MENPLKMDDLSVPPFQETSKLLLIESTSEPQQATLRCCSPGEARLNLSETSWRRAFESESGRWGTPGLIGWLSIKSCEMTQRQKGILTINIV